MKLLLLYNVLTRSFMFGDPEERTGDEQQGPFLGPFAI